MGGLVSISHGFLQVLGRLMSGLLVELAELKGVSVKVADSVSVDTDGDGSVFSGFSGLGEGTSSE